MALKFRGCQREPRRQAQGIHGGSLSLLADLRASHFLANDSRICDRKVVAQNRVFYERNSEIEGRTALGEDAFSPGQVGACEHPHSQKVRWIELYSSKFSLGQRRGKIDA